MKKLKENFALKMEKGIVINHIARNGEQTGNKQENLQN